MNDWTELAPCVRIMQEVMSNALEAGTEDSIEFLEATHNAQAPRVESLLNMGIDVTDEMVLFTFATGFIQAATVAHHVTHAYEFHSFDEDVDPDDECRLFVHSIISNLLPLMSLLPLHLILAHDDWNDDELDEMVGDA